MYALLFGGTNDGQEVFIGRDWYSVNVPERRRRPCLYFKNEPAKLDELRLVVETFDLHWACRYGRPVARFGVISWMENVTADFLDQCAERTIRGY
jgi:hypothetical protein